MQQSTYPPRPNSAPADTAGESEKVDLRKKLLDMIRRNESVRRETQK
ncbi:MAG: hypothetical protein ABI614_03940 [Planctomycetota bacterium]